MDDLALFCCQRPDCPLYGKRDAGNLSVCARFGKQDHIRLLYCNACKYRFSERKGTPLFGARLAPTTATAVLAHVAEGVGTRKTARLTGVHPDTVTRYARLAGDHAAALHDELVAFSPGDQ
jgi:transposase-like protein